jgi:hypothetical protein
MIPELLCAGGRSVHHPHHFLQLDACDVVAPGV